MTVVVSSIVGGLGNQMFQYACGRALSLRHGVPLEIVTDQFGRHVRHNGYELERVFGLRPRQMSHADLALLVGWRAMPRRRAVLAKLQWRWFDGPNLLCERNLRYSDEISRRKPPLLLEGYWQSERYFSDHVPQIRKDFRFALPWTNEDQAVLARMRQQPSISVHVRRADFLSAKNAGIYSACLPSYYRAAIEFMRSRVPGAAFFAFSDDPTWVREQLLPECDGLEVVSHNTGSASAGDMRLMSQADHHVIANSTFSWWAAWLNDRPDKLVVAPRKWFVSPTLSDADLVPQQWVRL